MLTRSLCFAYVAAALCLCALCLVCMLLLTLAGRCNSALCRVTILILQKRSLRIIEHAEHRAHTDPLFYSRKILKVKDIYSLQLGIFMYQYHNNELPNSFRSMFTTNKQIYSYNTRQCNKFHIPYQRTSQAQKFVSYQGPIFWNSLDKSLTNLKSIVLFKKKLKSVLLEGYSHS